MNYTVIESSGMTRINLENEMKTTKLRWKMSEKETGLASVTAGPRSYILWDGETEYAVVHARRRDWSTTGWMWYNVAKFPTHETEKKGCSSKRHGDSDHSDCVPFLKNVAESYVREQLALRNSLI